MDSILGYHNGKAVYWNQIDFKTTPRPTLLFEFIRDYLEKTQIQDLFCQVITETFSNPVMRAVMLADVELHVAKFIDILLKTSVQERAIVVSQFSEFEAPWFLRVLVLYLEKFDIQGLKPVKTNENTWLVVFTLEQFSTLYCKSLAFVINCSS